MKFILKGIPIAQSRPRVTMRGRFPHVFNPNETEKKKAKIQLLSIVSQTDYVKSSQYVTVKIKFKLPIPKTYSKIKIIDAIDGKVKPTKQDLDNLIKFILDVSNDILWDDDRLIDTLYASKEFGMEPSTEIDVEDSYNLLLTSRNGRILC